MVTIGSLKETMAKMGYVWFEDKPNIIAVRTELQVADVFNDLMFIVYKKDGEEKLFSAIVTTDPGTTYQIKPLNPKGCAAIAPGQYINAYKLGFHQGKSDHRALIQVGKIKVFRDNDKDGILELDPATIEEGCFGCNHHGVRVEDKKGNPIEQASKIGPWSAGCTVHERWSKKEEEMDIVQSYGDALVSYTVIDEKDLCQG